MKTRLLTTCFLSFFLLYSSAYANSQSLSSFKLAIFDNAEIAASDPVLSENLQTAYMQGVNTAIAIGHSKGIDIQKRTFFYGNNLLNILQQAPNVKTWNPDVIMGLHSSNASLMSNSLFTDPLILSISGTDIELANLPSNFYSLGTPDLYTANQLVNFISAQYPKKNLFLIIGAESKESVDLGNIVSNLYKEKNPKQTVEKNEFLSNDENTMDLNSLLNGYKPGDIILLFSLSGTDNSQISLMNKISDFVAPNKVIFITPVDNWKNQNILVSTDDTKNPYTALRLDTLFVDKNCGDYKIFAQAFKKIYHTNPVNNISFTTYQTVNSIITALQKYPPPPNLTTKQAILWSYHKAIKNNPDWFRQMKIVVYKIQGHKEVYFTSLEEKRIKK